MKAKYHRNSDISLTMTREEASMLYGLIRVSRSDFVNDIDADQFDNDFVTKDEVSTLGMNVLRSIDKAGTDWQILRQMMDHFDIHYEPYPRNVPKIPREKLRKRQ